MKVPKNIKKAIMLCAKYNALATEQNKIIRDWFDEKGLGEKDYYLDQLIDSCEIGYSPEEFINFLESNEQEVMEQ